MDRPDIDYRIAPADVAGKCHGCKGRGDVLEITTTNLIVRLCRKCAKDARDAITEFIYTKRGR